MTDATRPRLLQDLGQAAHFALLGTALAIVFLVGHSVVEVLSQGYAQLGLSRLPFVVWAIASSWVAKAGLLLPAILLALSSLGQALASVLPDTSNASTRPTAPHRLWRYVRHYCVEHAYALGPVLVITARYLDQGAPARGVALVLVALPILYAVLSRPLVSLLYRFGVSTLSPVSMPAFHSCALAMLIGVALQNGWYFYYRGLLDFQNLVVNALLIASSLGAFLILRYELLRVTRNTQTSPRKSRLLSPVSAPVLIPGVFILASLLFSALRANPTESTNVILITLDTVRADHLGCYGYERDTSPKIDAFARSATRYTRAFSSSPWTLPTHASLFTGKTPLEHGAHRFKNGSNNAVHPRFLTLAEVFKANGYRTAGIVANTAYLGKRWHMNQGFDSSTVENLRATELNQHVFRWLEANDNAPFFLFLNYMDAHWPYNTKPRPGLLGAPPSQDQELLWRMHHQILPRDGVPEDELLQELIGQYDTGIANLDEGIGALLDRLESLHLTDSTMVVMTSDHGEYFGEHDLIEHGQDLHQEVLWVPLLVRSPGQRVGRTDDTPVSSTDMPHMILAALSDVLGEEILALFPDTPGSGLTISQVHYARAAIMANSDWKWRFQRVRTALIEWPYKFIHSDDGQHELYHLERDPKERSNRITSDEQIARRLVERLRSVQADRSGEEIQQDHRPLSEEQEAQLRALGYLE